MKDTFIKFRCSETFKEALQEEATALSMSMSEYIMNLLSEEIRPAACISRKTPAAGLTISDVKKMYKGKYEDIEVYHSSDNEFGDTCDRVDNVPTGAEVIKYELMNESAYHVIYPEADFNDWFENKNAKILVCLV